LIIEEEVLGVIELASLNRFADFEIEFVEKLGQSIASTLRTVKINQKTAELLRKSQEQTEIMVSQEEEMRQNLEELQATQEEAARKTIEMEGLIDALNASSYVMEYDSQGNVININEAYLDLLNIRRDDAIGKHHSENLVMTDHQRMTYEEFWSNLRKGIIQKQTMRINIKEKDFSFLETYTPIRDANGDVYKVLKVAIDISMTSK
jgi:methyl-accepting chemotaxis protein